MSEDSPVSFSVSARAVRWCSHFTFQRERFLQIKSIQVFPPQLQKELEQVESLNSCKIMYHWMLGYWF